MPQSPLSNQEIRHYTNLWCREQGIHSRDLETHPQMDDVVLLINFREVFWPHMDSRERGIWAAYWGRTYTQKYPMKKSYFNQLEIITKSAEFRQHKQAQRVETIKAMRARANNKETMSS